jgi:hypothetical protein
MRLFLCRVEPCGHRVDLAQIRAVALRDGGGERIKLRLGEIRFHSHPGLRPPRNDGFLGSWGFVSSRATAPSRIARSSKSILAPRRHGVDEAIEALIPNTGPDRAELDHGAIAHIADKAALGGNLLEPCIRQ